MSATPPSRARASSATSISGTSIASQASAPRPTIVRRDRPSGAGPRGNVKIGGCVGVRHRRRGHRHLRRRAARRPPLRRGPPARRPRTRRPAARRRSTATRRAPLAAPLRHRHGHVAVGCGVERRHGGGHRRRVRGQQVAGGHEHDRCVAAGRAGQRGEDAGERSLPRRHRPAPRQAECRQRRQVAADAVTGSAPARRAARRPPAAPARRPSTSTRALSRPIRRLAPPHSTAPANVSPTPP